MSFDEILDRRGSHSSKWDMMEKFCGVSPDGGLAMWVAEMDFRAPDCVLDELRTMLDDGVFGYFGDDRAYRAAIGWWMRTRHGWTVEPDWIHTTHGLVNGAALCLDAFTQPGDAVVLMTPVYHAFHRVIKAAGREIRQCRMVLSEGRYECDFDAWDAQMTGNERIFLLCSPHNPGGRVWSRAELQAIAAFCIRHDLILISDEIHHDLVYPGHKHLPMPLAAPHVSDRLIMMTAPSKTFNIPGAHTGNVIISDPTLRERFAARLAGLGISPNSFGLRMETAAYSPAGADWLDELIGYLDENRKLFDSGIASIPGLSSMPLEATYLAWVDFSGTGMTLEEAKARVQDHARIAVNLGPTFGDGGETRLRFNLAMPRTQIAEAVTRLRAAFADLQ